MYDLIYFGSDKDYAEVRKLIADAFPGIVIEDASDAVHPYRFSIQSETVSRKDFIKFAIRQGFHECSLTIQEMMMGGERKAELEEVIKELEQEEKPSVKSV